MCRIVNLKRSVRMLKFENNPDAVLTEEHSAMEKRNYTGSFCGLFCWTAQGII